MSKFKESFDAVEVSGNLKRKTLNRIKEDKNSRRGLKGWKVSLIAVAAVLAVVMAFPSYIAISNAIGNPGYNFGKAIPVETESRLSGLLNKTEYQPVTFFSSSPGATEDLAAADSAKGSAGHSSTNVQVQGMDEGDIIKNDGQYIYRLSSGGFSITEADSGQLSPVCDIPVENFVPIEMYIRGKQLVLVGGGYWQTFDYAIDDLKGGGYMSCMSYHTNVQIRVFDLSDIANPVQTRFYQTEGYYHTSRIDEKTETLYFVINYYNGYYYYDSLGAGAEEARRPYWRDSEYADAAPLPVEDIYYFKNVPGRSYLILGAVDLNDPAAETEIKAYLGCSSITYVSGENLYISTFQRFYGILGEVSGTRSYIAKFSLSDLAFTGSNTVKGAPKDRYCLDEYKGYLRVATSYGSGRAGDEFACAVYVFDGDMNEASKITGIAKGEGIDSAAFSGDKGYISTSVRMTFDDPLFIIDFSNVKRLKISKGLKELGISSYLKAIDGTDYVIGFGTDSATNSSGWNEATGVKVQLYDMSGDEAKSAAKLVIAGNSSYAEVLNNPKALLYMYDAETKTGLIGFAAEQAEYFYTGNYSYIIKRQGLFLYGFDAAAGTLEEKGLLSNFPAGSNVYGYSYSGYNYQKMSEMYGKYVKRGIVIGDYIYTVGDSVITSYDLYDLNEIQVWTQ